MPAGISTDSLPYRYRYDTIDIRMQKWVVRWHTLTEEQYEKDLSETDDITG